MTAIQIVSNVFVWAFLTMLVLSALGIIVGGGGLLIIYAIEFFKKGRDRS